MRDVDIAEYDVFPGIRLIYRNIHTRRPECLLPQPEGVLEINHCRAGRYEYEVGDHFFYLAPGDLSISRSAAGMSAYFPTSHYCGVSVVIDPRCAPDCLSCLLDDVNVKPAALLEKFCGVHDCFIIRSTPHLEHIFSELYSVPDSIKKGYFKVKVLELLLFLSSMDPALSQTESHLCSKAQVQLAERVCAFVCAHMDSRMTIDQLAKVFHVSPSQLKNCFRSVYGDSVYAYIRTRKMQAAAKLLLETDRTILDIAGACGYDNGSKFARAFCDVVGMTPKAFRQSGGAGLKST